MPPRRELAPASLTRTKRKAREETDRDGVSPIKRTRSSGLQPSHFVPIDGAPSKSALLHKSPPKPGEFLSAGRKAAMLLRDAMPLNNRGVNENGNGSDVPSECESFSSSVDPITIPKGSGLRNQVVVELPGRRRSSRSQIERPSKRPQLKGISSTPIRVPNESEGEDDGARLRPTRTQRNPASTTTRNSLAKTTPMRSVLHPKPDQSVQDSASNGSSRNFSNQSPRKRARITGNKVSPPQPFQTQDTTSQKSKPQYTSLINPTRLQERSSNSWDQSSMNSEPSLSAPPSDGEDEVEHALLPDKANGLLRSIQKKSPLHAGSVEVQTIKRPEFGAPKSQQRPQVLHLADDNPSDSEQTLKAPEFGATNSKTLTRNSFHLSSPGFDGRTHSTRPDLPAEITINSKAALTPQPTTPRVSNYPLNKVDPASPSKTWVTNREPILNDAVKSKSSSAPRSSPSSPMKVIMPVKPFAEALPSDLAPFLNIQKRASLRALAKLPELKGEAQAAVTSLFSLLEGTTTRGEGNSCLVLGPRRSGKTRLVEEVVRKLSNTKSYPLSSQPILIRLSGHVHTNDRMALREIGRQLMLQDGGREMSFHGEPDDEEEDAGDDPDDEQNTGASSHVLKFLPPPSHMASLITTMSSLPRPTIVILDAFDLFTSHARQALLYCLLDTVQSCRSGEGRKGVAVVGITSRVDTLNLLEKRVKSRFSHRIIRCPPPNTIQLFTELIQDAITSELTLECHGEMMTAAMGELIEEKLGRWNSLWTKSIDSCFGSRETQRVIKETFELARDVDLLRAIMAQALATLNFQSPWLSSTDVAAAALAQRSHNPWSFLQDLPFPLLALLVAAYHAQTSGHDAFTFEHLFDTYSRATKLSTNVNASVDGVGVGLMRVSRETMAGAFEELIAAKILLHAGASSASTSQQFIKYRCDVLRPDIRHAVEAKGQTQLKRWLTRPI